MSAAGDEEQRVRFGQVCNLDVRLMGQRADLANEEVQLPRAQQAQQLVPVADHDLHADPGVLLDELPGSPPYQHFGWIGSATDRNVTILFYFGVITTLVSAVPAFFVWQEPSANELMLLVLAGAVVLFFSFREREQA